MSNMTLRCELNSFNKLLLLLLDAQNETLVRVRMQLVFLLDSCIVIAAMHALACLLSLNT